MNRNIERDHKGEQIFIKFFHLKNRFFQRKTILNDVSYSVFYMVVSIKMGTTEEVLQFIVK